MAGDGRARPGDHVVVVLHARRVGDKGPQAALVLQQGVRAACDVGVHLRLRGHRGRSGHAGEGTAGERVVARENDRLPILRDRDAVLVVVPAHAVDRAVLPIPDVERNDKAGLALRRAAHRGRPGRLLAEHVVGGLLVREEDAAAEPLLRGGQVVRAEALVAEPARDGERAAEHSARLPVESQPAQLGVVEVVLPVGRRGSGWVVGERGLAGLVVDEEVDPSLAPVAHGDAIRDGLEPVATPEHVSHGQQWPDLHARLDGGEHRGLLGPEPEPVGRECGRGR
jgi:hypothetical protein